MRRGPAVAGRGRRGTAVLVLLGVLALAAWPLARFLLTPPEVREAAAGLRSSAVVVPDDARDVLDVDRVRAVVGDRPLVVAVLRDTYDGDALDGCRALARQQPRNLVLLYRAASPGSYPAVCDGSRFPQPDVPEPRSDALGDRLDLWLFRLNLVAERSSRYRVASTVVDRTPEVEAFVLALDEQVARDYPDGIPRRVASPEPETLARVLVQLLGLLGLLLAAFAGLRAAAVLVERRVDGDRELEARRAALGSDLSRVSALLLQERPEGRRDAERVEHAAELYLLALGEVEAAADAAALERAGQTVAKASAAASR